MKILITGNTGFIGSKIVSTLGVSQASLVLPVRNRAVSQCRLGHNVQYKMIGDIDKGTNWHDCLEGVDVIVHCAAISDGGQKYNFQHSQALRCVNVDGTLKLASQAASAGVRRFVFLSSIKVNGAYTEPHVPFTPEGIASPTDAYGMSKFEAEQGLKDICQKQDMEFVIIRSPLVYGPGVKGNFRMLMEFVEYGIPLPFSNIRNKRSLIGVDNLVDLVITCVSHPQATDQIFLASDDDDLSTPELLSGIAQALGKPARLFSCPKNVLAAAAKCIGKAALAQKLLESLQVDISETKRLLSWVPPLSVKDGLDRCFPTT